MSTAAQINANRKNAKKSTGPRTDKGKQASSRNAVTHGLSGRIAFLSDEDRLLYAARHQRFIREMEPVTLIEEDLVHTVADSSWQVLQYRAYDQQIRAELLSESPAEDGPSESHSIRIDFEAKGTLGRLARYLAHHTRALNQAIQEFEKQKKARLAAARAQAIADHEQSTGAVFNPKWHGISVPNGFDLQQCEPFQFLRAIQIETLQRQVEIQSQCA